MIIIDGIIFSLQKSGGISVYFYELLQRVIKHEESYTSKCSFLDNEPIERHASYLGKRVKRGLFKSSTGKLINADVNGSLNILRKVMGDFEFDPIRVCSTPKVINVLKQNMVFH